MKRNGFSLVEMLGIIILLSILFLTSFVAVDQRLGKEREKLYDIQLTNLKLKLENWSLDDTRLRPTSSTEEVYITLAQLKYAGYVEKDIENPKTGKQFSDSMTFKISLDGRRVVFDVVENTITDAKDDKTVILIEGADVEVYTATGSGYDDPGFKALVDGVDQTSKVLVSGEANLSTKGVHQITYMLNDVKVIRNIIVR